MRTVLRDTTVPSGDPMAATVSPASVMATRTYVTGRLEGVWWVTPYTIIIIIFIIIIFFFYILAL